VSRSAQWVMGLLALLFIGGFGVAGYVVFGGASEPSKVSHPRYRLVLDRSANMQASDGDVCQHLDVLLPVLLEDKKRNRLADLIVYLTGDRNPEDGAWSGPIKIAEVSYRDLVQRGGLEARADAKEVIAARTEEILAEVRSACQGRATVTAQAPIYQTMNGVVSDLAQNCEPEDHCKVLFYSDLDESLNPWICTRIYGEDAYGEGKTCVPNEDLEAPNRVKADDGAKALQWSENVIPMPVAAPGVTIVTCGLFDSNNADARRIGPNYSQRIIATWKGLFPEADMRVLHACEW
jgi:hypothetical protein